MPQRPPHRTKPKKGPFEDFFKELDEAKKKTRRGQFVDTPIGKECFYVDHFLRSSDVNYDDFHQHIKKTVPKRAPILKGGATSFQFKAPVAVVKQRKYIPPRVLKLKELTEDLRNFKGLSPKQQAITDSLKGKNPRERALELQKLQDKGIDVDQALLGAKIAMALESDKQLRTKLSSSDEKELVSGLFDLHTDRVKETSKELLNDKDRREALIKYHSELFGIPRDKLPKNEDAVKKALRSGPLNIFSVHDDNNYQKELARRPGDKKTIDKKWRQHSKRFLLAQDLKHTENYANPLASKIKKVAQGTTFEEGKNTKNILVDFKESPLDLFSGTLGGDCSKCKEEKLMAQGMVVGKFREFDTVPEDGKIIGSVYIARGDHRGKPVLHIDAFQPHKSEAVPAKFVENFLKELKKQKDPQFRTISMNSGAQFSNHEPYQAAIKKVLGSLQHSNSKVTGLPESSQSSSRSGHIVLGSKNE